MRASRVSQRRGYKGEYECLADFAKGDPLRCLFKCCLEPFDWFAQWLETEAESLMMHRHDKLGAGGVCHFNRLLRRAMRSDPRIVSADRHDREIDTSVRAQFGKAVGQRGVPGKKNAP